jgi:Ca2+-binding EF-hand superfamily protein
MTRAAAAVGVLLIACLAAPGAPVLMLPGAKESSPLRLEILLDGRPPAATWDAFLDHLFNWFDRDGDGSLSRAEVSRIFPLPLPGGKQLTIDFAKLDTGGKGKARPADLKAYCRANGFGPVVAVVAPPSADDLRLADLFLRRLDPKGDGKLTRDGLRRLPEVLRKYDLNEDEFLDLAELLAAAGPGPRPVEARVKLAAEGAGEDAILRVDAGTKAAAPTIEGSGVKALRLVPAPAAGGIHRVYGPEGRWVVAFRAARTVPDVGSAGEFLVAQFKAALGDRPSLGKADLESDPGLSGLTAVFPYADRDGDNRLTLAELEEYLRLIELGVRSQVWVRVADHGRNPFPFLDADGDGRLSYAELTRAAELIRPELTEGVGLPEQFHLSFGGPAVKSLGGVPIPALAKRPRTAAADDSAAPAWFRAMDRNGDGVISPWEFLGPPEVFRKLDLNGDGVITPDEAARASGR